MRIKKLERQQFAMHANTYWWDANNEYDEKKEIDALFQYSILNWSIIQMLQMICEFA